MISIYIHIPFCLKKCNYCGFVSVDNISDTNKNNYISALIKEIKLAAKTYNLTNKKINTIFFGGGTPSILETNTLNKILIAVKNNFDASNLKEVSIEVNPATNIDFSELKEIGFNRISIGVQSFNDTELKFLGRLHNSKLAENTILNAQKEFKNISIDLIYGIPKQNKSMFEYSIDKAIELGISHISAYSMSYEQGTKLYEMLMQKKIKTATENTEFDMYIMLCNKLAANNIQQYEVSNFAKKRIECKHNKNYWKRTNYIGFGLAAHSLLNNIRWENTSNLDFYVKQLSKNILPINNKEILTKKQINEEQIFLGLRSKGINQKILNAQQIQFMEECIKMNFATKKSNTFVLTNKGRFLTDYIVLKIL